MSGLSMRAHIILILFVLIINRAVIVTFFVHRNKRITYFLDIAWGESSLLRRDLLVSSKIFVR